MSQPAHARDHTVRSEAKRLLGPVVRGFGHRRRDLPLSAWRLERNEDGALALDGVVLHGLLERWGSPLHVVDAARLASNAADFTARPPGSRRACEVFYSYKTNPVPGILRLLHANGLGAEVVSPYELWLALRLGVDPKAIVYNGPTRSEESMNVALARRVGLININSRGQIAPLDALASRLGVRPTVGIRVVEPGGIGGQFGERIDTGAALAAFEEARSRPALRVAGLHAHLNGEIASRDQLDRFLSALLAFTDVLRARLGLELEVLDIGGNLASPTVTPLSSTARRLAITFGREPVPRDPESVLSIPEYVSHVTARVEGHYAAIGRLPPRIILEPGRAVTSNAQMLLCRVAARRDADAADTRWIVLDAGINVAEAVRTEIHQLFPLARRAGAREYLHRITGPSCTLGDLLYPAWRLPELSVGDGVAIMDSGAYFVPFATCFSFPRPAVVVLDGGHEEVVRRAEAFEDLTALDLVRG